MTAAVAFPPGACDAHCHVWGPRSRFPFAEDRPYTPPDVPKEELRALHRVLGIERAVIVQSVPHGADHRALLDALAAGAGRYRGVALLGPGVDADELHAAGCRGARINVAPHLGPPPSAAEIRALADRIRPYGWHLDVHVMGNGIAELAPLLSTLGVRVVIDHMARVDLSGGFDTPPIRALRGLLDGGDVWVKLSGADRIATNPPELGDAAAFAKLLADAAPERVLWGTDFPHPNVRYLPDDGHLADQLAVIAPDPSALRRILVTNPVECFGFA